MALATRCPHCQTAFKVANDQLKLHAGLVRCGSCQQTFNAVENLIPSEVQKPPQAAPVKPAAAALAAEPVAAKTPVNVVAAEAVATTSQADTSFVSQDTQPAAKAAPVTTPAITPAATSAENAVAGADTMKALSPKPVAPVKPVTNPAAQVLPADSRVPVVAVPEGAASAPTPATVPAVGKSGANGKVGAEVLAAISKAEKEFEAAHLDKPKTGTTASVARPIATTPEIVAANARLEPRLDTRTAKPEAAVSPKADSKIEPKLETVGSATALDFDLGDGGFLLPSEEVHEADLARVELETRAALMDPPTADWSVSEVQDETEEKAAWAIDSTTDLKIDLKADQKTDSAAKIPEAHEAGSKVWRHKDHGDTPELDNADSISDRALEELDKASGEQKEHSEPYRESHQELHQEPDQEQHLEPYIGAEEAALASRAAANEDSSSDAEEDQPKPNFVIQAEKQKARKRISTIMLSLSIVLLLPLLLAQSAYVLRNQLAARVPETKPYLLQACKFLQCQVTLPAQIEKIVIDSNELQNLAPERNVFMLVMQLQNQSDVVQTWPQVELVLNDVKEKPLLQRAFKPEDYLTDKDKLAKGFAAGSEQNIKLYFELPTVKAAGFKVALFYP